MQGHADADGRAFAEPHEIDMQREVSDRIEMEVARNHAVLLALEIDVVNRGQEAAGQDALAERRYFLLSAFGLAAVLAPLLVLLALKHGVIDVLLTRRDKAAEKISGVEKITSEAILRNVRVLAIDQAVEEKAGQRVVVGRTATLELNPDQAETLELSRQLGSLSLVLRSLVDSQSMTAEGGDDVYDTRGPMNTVRYGVSTLSITH